MLCLRYVAKYRLVQAGVNIQGVGSGGQDIAAGHGTMVKLTVRWLLVLWV